MRLDQVGSEDIPEGHRAHEEHDQEFTKGDDIQGEGDDDDDEILIVMLVVKAIATIYYQTTLSLMLMTAEE